MGRRVPPGAGGQLTLRFRLLAAAAGIVATSLVLAGALTWFFVRDLEFQTVQEQMDRQIMPTAAAVRHQECLNRPLLPGGAGSANCRLAPQVDFTDRLDAMVPQLAGNRLLLLDANRRVVYDSGGAASFEFQLQITASKRVANVGEATTTLDGQTYLAAAIRIPAARNPLGASYVVLAQPESLAASAAAGELASRLLLAGVAALLAAMALTLLVSQSLARPLTQLAAAAEDIAAGNYSRRVGIRGSDEIGKLGLAFDRMAEAVERARKVQRDFLANVSHELKTPLTSLIGFSQALVDGSLTTESEKERAATIVHEESERVLRMAQELLDLARVEAGSISMHISAVDLAAQLQQELEIVKPRAAARNLTLQAVVPANLPPVAADPERLHQVIGNLLDNAVKYAPDGSTVRTEARLNVSGVETVVANPAGAHRPDPERMFERFYRADPSRSAAAGGVGLGLAISRQLVAAMRGKLWADIDSAGSLNMHLLLPASGEVPPRPAPDPPAPAL